MPPTKSGLKRARSQMAEKVRQTRFTTIVDRQDGLCWFCGDDMGSDCTREHLLSQVLDGTNDDPPGNLKAAHGECNSAAGHLPVSDKYRLREIGRTEGRHEMIRAALQMRRADTRIAFSKDPSFKVRDKPKPKGFWRSRSYLRF